VCLTHFHARCRYPPFAFIEVELVASPKRDAWQKPHEVITALALPPDAVVADIGAGTGYFAMRRRSIG